MDWRFQLDLKMVDQKHKSKESTDSLKAMQITADPFWCRFYAVLVGNVKSKDDVQCDGKPQKQYAGNP
jgi:hypothetical protein